MIIFVVESKRNDFFMYVKKKMIDYSDCPVRIAIDILSTSWNAWLILEIHKGVVRPCDLQRSISVAPKRVLTKQLGELERMGILQKVVYPVLPLKVEYSLTEAGKELIPIIDKLWQWGDKYKTDFLKRMSGDEIENGESANDTNRKNSRKQETIS